MRAADGKITDAEPRSDYQTVVSRSEPRRDLAAPSVEPRQDLPDVEE